MAKNPPKRIVILGAAGRDFYNFNTLYRDDPSSVVVAFTAAQIPGIATAPIRRHWLVHVIQQG